MAINYFNRKRIRRRISSNLDRKYIQEDRKRVLRTRNILRIPTLEYRKGGKISYAEWAHVIGIFQTIICQNLDKKVGNKILDVGCGTGILGIAAEPFVKEEGQYIGIDVKNDYREYWEENFPEEYFEFIHFDAYNPTYSSGGSKEKAPWPFEDNSFDMVTALSVWTHMVGDDASYYLSEVARVLKKEGKAIITFFYLDEIYFNTVSGRNETKGKYHNTLKSTWIFDQKAYKSDQFFCPKWVKNPEDAIGVNSGGMRDLLKKSMLEIDQYYPGSWKEMPGIYFQDLMILKKV